LFGGVVGDVGDGMDITTDDADDAVDSAVDSAMDEVVDDATVGSGDGKVNEECLRCGPSV
jgi:hypothetical protein